MKKNNLLDGINTDINIEKGLKILQFGTQFYLHRTYLRNCPLVHEDDDEDDHIEKQKEDAELIAELNEFLINPAASQNKQKLQRDAKQIITQSHHKVQMLKQPEKVMAKPPNSSTSEPRKIAQKTQKDEVDKYVQKKKSPQISIPEKQKKQEQIRQKLAKKIQKIASPLNRKQNVAISQQSEYPSPESSLTSSVKSVSLSDKSSGKGSKDDQKKSVQFSDLASYYSDCKPLGSIKEQNSKMEAGSQQIPSFKKDRTIAEAYNISDFISIRQELSIGNSTFVPKQQKEPKAAKINRSIQAQVRSENHSFLNKSISRIKQSNERSFLSEPKANETELNLLKEISDSFAEEEKMKHLLKLQNLELQEKFLLQRMEKRFQNCDKNIGSIRSISWASLKMPQTELIFRRPDYAHCLEPLQ